jgi:hypothetical protein
MPPVTGPGPLSNQSQCRTNAIVALSGLPAGMHNIFNILAIRALQAAEKSAFLVDLLMFHDAEVLSRQACRRQRRRISFVFVSSSVLQTDSCCCGQKLWNSNEIVGGCGENEEPLDQSAAAMAGLAQAADSLNPAERFFDPLALHRADAIAGMTSGAAIDCRAAISIILRDVRRATALAAARDKVGGVIVLVTFDAALKELSRDFKCGRSDS